MDKMARDENNLSGFIAGQVAGK